MDCNGDCFGEALVDMCYECAEGNSGIVACIQDTGTWGGNLEIDECGDCGGDGPEGSYTCDDIPDGFAWFQSPSQAFYFVTDADINDYTLLIEDEDWIGAFYGDICIGSRRWNGSPTDIPVMGFHSDYPETHSYIIPGEVPRFIIYDASENSYYDAQVDYDPLEEDLVFGGGMLEIHSIDKLRVERDCDGNLGAPDGDPYLDDCDVCSEGDTGHPFNSDIDCNGDCFGEALFWRGRL
jgi:hypothetical protein